MLPSKSVAENRSVSKISINAGNSLGPLPFLFRAGMFLNEYPLGQMYETYFQELKPGAVHIMPLRDGAESSNLKEYVEGLPSFPSTKWAIEVKKRGGIPVIGLTEIPKWLQRSSSSDAYLRPPRDFAGWSDFVEANVRFFNNKLNLDAEYVLWDEPDLQQFWKGATNEEYFNLYRAFVLGARRADPRSRVGGPAVSWWGSLGQGSDEKNPMVYDFIRYCAKTKLPELALKRLPIDFIVWHQFDTEAKGDPLQYTVPVERIRGWLKNFGYNPDTTLINGSWNSWLNYGKDPNELSPERDSEYTAAYVIQALEKMDHAGIHQHNFFNLFEKWQWDTLNQKRQRMLSEKPFFGGFGIFNRSGLIKPVFNAFKLLGMLEGDRVEVESEDPYLTLIASRTKNKLFLIISNFYFPGGTSLDSKREMLLKKGYKSSDFLSWKKNITPQMMSELNAGKRSIDDLPIPENAKKDLKKLSYLDKYHESKNAAKSVNIHFSSVPFAGGVRVDAYLINNKYGNSLRADNLLSNAVLKVRQNTVSEVGDLLIQWKMVKSDFKKMDIKSQLNTIKTLVPGMSKSRKDKVKNTTQIAAGKVLKQINRSDPVQVKKITGKKILRINPEGYLNISAEVMPYSVQLIVLTATKET
jgi:hypothetical protein